MIARCRLTREIFNNNSDALTWLALNGLDRKVLNHLLYALTLKVV
jgi:hypothetical protein